MRDLNTILENDFENNCLGSYYYQSFSSAESKSMYLTVPISKDSFEIPVFAIQALEAPMGLTGESLADCIVINLAYIGTKASYKSLDANIRSVLSTKIHNAKLIQLPRLGDPGRVYYGTHGAIFDDNFNPVMMLTWEFERVHSEESPTNMRYKFIKPVVRVKPEVVINKCNALERYIVNKVIPSALSLDYITIPKLWNVSGLVANDSPYQAFKAKTIIDRFPFKVNEIDRPSVSTTNEELLNVALDNLEELVL